MDTLLMMLLTFGGYILMYKFYGKFIGQKIFGLDDSNKAPSVQQEDGIDYVPTKKEIIFGHHFASIAGTGPIVGPAIAVIWGWLPAVLWVFFGSIFIGAVHDFGVLIVSMRNQGKSIGDIAGKYINKRIKFIFFIIVFIELWILISVFGLVIALIFDMFPASIIPVWAEIPIAVLLGFLINKRGKNIWTWSIYAVILMYITVYIGYLFPYNIPEIFGIPPTGIWTIILLIYAYIASVLPVGTLLQPRDFINSHQLLIAMILLVVGVFFSSFAGELNIVAPAIQTHPTGAPSMWPYIFLIIACGAVSGFHSLVSSGTSSKQIINEKDSLFVGYGGMLTEGALATLVIIATVAGIGMGYENQSGETLFGVQAWTDHYSSWVAAKGLGSKLTAFVIGSANMIETLGIPNHIAQVIMGVFVVSFAGTTLDTATRIQRYILTETFPKAFANKYVSTSVVIILALALIFSSGANGKGALNLWPLFGATNQTLAGLALIIITVFLKTRGGLKWLISAIPAAFMIVVSFWALWLNQINFMNKGNVLLSVINVLIMLSVVWIVIEAIRRFIKIDTLDYDPKTGAVKSYE